MEFAILTILVIVFILFLIRRGKDWEKRSAPYTPTSSPQPPTFAPRPLPQPAKTPPPEPFNPNTTVAKPTQPVLEGPARIIDGDSLVIQKTQIRLFGVDAPEMDHPFGKKAKWALVSLCKGQTVKAEVTAQDTHGRTVAKCFLPDGRDLSAEMVKLGLAIDWPKYSEGAYSALEASDVRKKLWLADARQKGHMHLWDRYKAKKAAQETTRQ